MLLALLCDVLWHDVVRALAFALRLSWQTGLR